MVNGSWEKKQHESEFWKIRPENCVEFFTFFHNIPPNVFYSFLTLTFSITADIYLKHKLKRKTYFLS